MIQSIKKMTLGLMVLMLSFMIDGCTKKTSERNAIQESDGLPAEVNLALTPPMGWNSWNAFGENVSEQVIRETADAMVASGLKEVGFSYIVIDDIWQGGRDSITGLLYPDPVRFPSGIKALADYVHSRGLKFGIYSDAGTQTCGDKPGSYGYEKQDAQLFADWGVDYLKYDYCYCPDYASENNDYKMAIERYRAMGDALKSTGRPIVYSICEWGARSPWLWGKEVGGHLWRTSYDVYDMWDSPRNESSPIGILASIDVMVNLGRFAGKGGWNDPDMLVVGLKNTGNIRGGGCSDIEYRSQMSMWCMLSAPLMVGSDIRNMSESTGKILLNKDIIAIDQDTMGIQGIRVIRKDGIDAWKKPLSNDRIAIAFLNRNSGDVPVTASWNELELDSTVQYSVYDVWEHKSVNHAENMISTKLKPHECQVFVFSPSEAK